MSVDLRPRALLLLFVEGKKRYVSDLDDLKSNAGNITNGVTLSTESGDENLVVFLDIIETTITGYERRDFFTIFD